MNIIFPLVLRAYKKKGRVIYSIFIIYTYNLPVVMVRKRSCPAVSQICNLIRLPSNSIVRILKSIPIVVMKEGVNESSEKRSNKQLLPTPTS